MFRKTRMKRSGEMKRTGEMKRSRMNRNGKKGKAWQAARADLVARFERAGITTCEFRYPEICWGEVHGFAHTQKRSQHPEMYRNGRLYEVVAACNPCHDVAEKMTPDRMEIEILSIIERRVAQP